MIMARGRALTSKAFDAFVIRLLACAATGIGVFVAAQHLLRAPCWGLFVLVTVIAWPIWYYQQQNALFQRRAMLSAVSEEGSRLRRWFWAGAVTRIFQVLVALIWSVLLLGYGTLLSPSHWQILAADVLILSLLVAPGYRRLAGEVRTHQVGLVTRRWVLAPINIAVLTVAFLVVDFHSGVPDTRWMKWHAVADTAFWEVAEGAECLLSGWFVGVLTAVDRLSWHAAEVLIPSLPDQRARLVVWGIFLIQAGAVAFAFTRLMLGMTAALEVKRIRLSHLTGESAVSRYFVATILLLAGPYLYLSALLTEIPPPPPPPPSPCKVDDSAGSRLATDLDEHVGQAAKKAKRKADEQVEASMDKLFADVEAGVEGYLDWYFSVTGEYERLAAVAAGELAESMASEVERHLFEQTAFAARLENMSAEVVEGASRTMANAAKEAGQRVRFELAESPCLLEGVNISGLGNLRRDKLRASVAATSGVSVATLSAAVALKKAVAAVPAKMVSKKGLQVGAGMASKAAAKKGGSSLLSVLGAAAACSPGGPVAALCGIGAGLTTWILVDKAFVEVDEVINRDEMRAEILASLREQRQWLSEQLRARHHGFIDSMAMKTQTAIHRVFVPSRDG